VAGGTVRGGSDAEEARWVERVELQEQSYRLAPLTVQVIEKAFRLGLGSDLSHDEESEA
jgi:hypothetical protein